MILLAPAPHEIVYIDPPWPRTPCGTAVTPYRTMSWPDLLAFDLGAWLAKDAVVFCWMTGPTHLKEAAVLSRWCERFGLHEAGIAYVWVKTTRAGKPIGASGPRPKLVKQLGEFVIALTTRKRGRVFPLLTEAQPQWVYAPKAPHGSHSSKPALVRERIVELLGDRERVEIFARTCFPGWNSFGDELAHPVDVAREPGVVMLASPLRAGLVCIQATTLTQSWSWHIAVDQGLVVADALESRGDLVGACALRAQLLAA